MADRKRRTPLKDMFYGAVTVGQRGQVVIPAEARRMFGVRPGDKLLVFRHPHIRGVLLARVDDVQALLEELAKCPALVSGIIGQNEGGSRSG